MGSFPCFYFSSPGRKANRSRNSTDPCYFVRGSVLGRRVVIFFPCRLPRPSCTLIRHIARDGHRLDKCTFGCVACCVLHAVVCDLELCGSRFVVRVCVGLARWMDTGISCSERDCGWTHAPAFPLPYAFLDFSMAYAWSWDPRVPEHALTGGENKAGVATHHPAPVLLHPCVLSADEPPSHQQTHPSAYSTPSSLPCAAACACLHGPLRTSGWLIPFLAPIRLPWTPAPRT